jgi:D-alanyl-D-alanine carboxypeptidase (penicillin-binding protein 5/6)
MRMHTILRLTVAVSLALGAASAAAASTEGPLRYGAGAGSVRFVPALSAKSYIAIDADTGEVLVAHRERVRRPIASLTKVMTGLLVIERGGLDALVTVPRFVTRIEPELEWLVPGQRFSRLTLLYSSLLVSANDSAATLGWDAGGGSLARFYAEMTWKARVLGMSDTTYASANGLDDRTNLSTAYDQAVLARYALQNPEFAKIVATRRYRVLWPKPVYAKVWINHDKMLRWDPSVYGVKTGYTSKAGGCVITAARRNGHRVIAVVLGSNSIWGDMPRLLNRAFARIR